MSYALPDYLARAVSFDDCPPGHRFGLYFDGWESGWHKPSNKTPAFKKVADALPTHSRHALSAIRARQAQLAQQSGDFTLQYPARLSAPLATGLGNEHPLENGFAFLNPHGLPYLAGSGVKGVLRRAAEELAGDEWNDASGWDQASIDILFGLETASGDTNATRTRGALAFWDLFFQPPHDKNALAVDIMTPHHSGYLQGSGTPHANEPPNPIPFLTIPAGCECTLYIQCNPALIPADFAARYDNWKTLIEAAIEHAGDWLGFGAKTAVGYGRLAIDPKVQQERDAARERQEKERQKHEAEAALSALPADEQLLGRLDQHLGTLPADPRTTKVIVQPTSGKDWLPTLAILDQHVSALTNLSKAQRESLASAVKKSLIEHFKIEGKADKAMKERLAAIRGT